MSLQTWPRWYNLFKKIQALLTSESMLICLTKCDPIKSHKSLLKRVILNFFI
ncbi:hypothetical protein HanIR_Chr01g0008431 [Helianthus annuus]|nr:hypothetical protein HanIR_Chr01g0008431 [Helianthus annuus]